MKFHPAANIFPLLEGAEFDALVEDIREYGQLESIWIHNRKALDGRNRYRACEKLGLDCDVQEWEGDDPLAFVISLNLKRRHLNESQRAMVAARIANRKDGQRGPGAKTKTKKAAHKCAASTQEDVATSLNVGRRSVQHAKKVQEKGTSEQVAAVDRGEATVSAVVRDIDQAEERKQAKRTATKAKKRQAKDDVGFVTDLRELIDAGRKFPTIYADPPWKYGNQGTRASTDNHYKTMPVADIMAEPVAELAADDAHLHLWTTNAFIFEAKEILEAWGFTYKSMFVWVKPQMGIGNYWRVSHELMLFGLKGRLPFENRAQMSWLEHPRTKHSVKPPPVRQAIEKVSPGPRLELYGRQLVEGWTVYGDEVLSPRKARA